MRTAVRCPGRWRASSSAASSAWRSRACPTTCLRCGRCSTAGSPPRARWRGASERCAPSPRTARRCRRPSEQAFRLERLVMRGDVDAGYLQAIGVSSPDAVVAELEDNLRALLRDMVCGHLALDLTGIADELLQHARRAADGRDQGHGARAAAPEPEFVVRKSRGPMRPRIRANRTPRKGAGHRRGRRGRRVGRRRGAARTGTSTTTQPTTRQRRKLARPALLQHLAPLRARREQVPVDLREAVDVVHVLVEVGNAQHAVLLQPLR